MLVRVPLIRSNGDQIVYLPEGVSFPPQVRDVTIVRQNGACVVTPAESAWNVFFEERADNFPDRDQPGQQMRESFDEASDEDQSGDEDVTPPSR